MPIKDVPRRIYPHYTAIIKFRADVRIALAVNLVARKCPDMWPRRASIEDILLVLDLDVLLPGFDYRPICVRPREAHVQIGMIRLILQFSRNLKWSRLASTINLGTEKIAKPQIGTF